ncbi:MAG: DsbA family protein [Arenicellales bacterium]|nr:DsbA family protein [Arenicellales bacterium]
MAVVLYYAHDPMCSWCWAFRPAWDYVCQSLPGQINLVRLLGGLAPDSNEPMPEALQHMLQKIWRNIEARIPGTEFNFDFWSQCRPRRSTYPACRAVIAAVKQGQEHHETMTKAIQHAYYLQARNPSDESTLIALAEELQLDMALFKQDLNSTETHQELKRQIELCYQLGIPGFPSLVLRTGNIARRIPVEFNDPPLQLQLIEQAAGIAA